MQLTTAKVKAVSDSKLLAVIEEQSFLKRSGNAWRLIKGDRSADPLYSQLLTYQNELLGIESAVRPFVSNTGDASQMVKDLVINYQSLQKEIQNLKQSQEQLMADLATCREEETNLKLDLDTCKEEKSKLVADLATNTEQENNLRLELESTKAKLVEIKNIID